MALIFNPAGTLNVARDPSDLPETVDQMDITSTAMVRCKNLRLNQQGIAKTRDGSAKLNESAINAAIWWIEVQAGVRFTFAGTSIYSNESSIASGLTSAQWTAIQYNAFNDTVQNVFALNGTDRKRIQSGAIHEWGLDAPTAAPTVGVGAGAGLTGTYNVKYTYVRKVGAVVVAESNPSPAGVGLLLNSQSLSVSVTQPTDPQVTHIRLYRTAADGASYFYAQEIAIGVTYAYGYVFAWESSDAYITGTGYKFTTTDATNASEDTFTWEATFTILNTTLTDTVYTYVAPFDTFDTTQPDSALSDLAPTDHDRPPLGSFVIGPAYDGTCFAIKDNLLYYCKPKQPEYWPALYYIEVSAPQFVGKTLVFHNGQLYFLTVNEIYYIQGTGHGTFLPLPMKAKCGAQSIRGAVSVPGKGIFHIGPDGIYLFGSGSDVKITEEAFEPIFRGETIQGIPGVSDLSTSWLYMYRGYLYFGYTSTGYSYPTNVLVMNMENGQTAYFTYDDGSPIEIRAIATDETNKRLVIGDNSGFVRVIESPSYTDDSGEAIDYEVQSKDFILSTRRHFPRWTKYDVEVPEGSTCTGSMILGGAVLQTHAITGSRNTRRRLITTDNGNRAAIRLSGQGPISFYSSETE